MDNASQVVGSSLDIARKFGEKGNEAHTLRLIADIGRHRECINSTGVERAYDRALLLATDLGMRPLIAHCHFGLGKLSQRAGDGVKAHEHLSASTDLFRELEMSFWLQRAQAEMRALYHETGGCK